MKTLIFTAMFFAACIGIAKDNKQIRFDDFPLTSVPENFTNCAPHPRLFLLPADAEFVKANLSKNRVLMRAHKMILAEAERIKTLSPIKRKVIGRRMLQNSREAMARIFNLSYAWRMTGDKSFAAAAEREMLAVCNYKDWHESHFLDTAEMALGVAVGYDWCFDAISDDVKKTILNSLKTKALEKSNRSYLKNSHNWNQVCNCGMTAAALCVLDDAQFAQQAREILACAVNSLSSRAFKQYDPDGVYAEGAGYWEYGTAFHLMMSDMLKTAVGRDFGLTNGAGLRKSPRFQQFCIAPSSKFFNFSDCPEKGYLQLPLVRLAYEIGDTSFLYPFKMFWDVHNNENLVMGTHGISVKETCVRYLPSIMKYLAKIDFDKIKQPSEKFFAGRGESVIAVVRTNWEACRGLYLAVKGGIKRAPHAHCDRGSFVYETDGVRWAEEIQMLPYNFYESRGIQYFGSPDKFKLMRVSNFSHNAPIVNDEFSKPYVTVDIVETFDTENLRGAKFNLSALYSGNLKSAFRTAVVIDGSRAEIRDEFCAAEKPAKIRWNMMTCAKVEIENGSVLKLSKDGKVMYLRARCRIQPVAKIFKDEIIVKGDIPIEGASAVGFEFELPANESVKFVAEFSEK